MAEDIAGLLARATVHHEDLILYRISQPKDKQLLSQWVKILADPERYTGELNGGVEGGGVHPVYAANVAYAVLMEVVGGARPTGMESEALSAVETFFEHWVEPSAVPIRDNAVSWGYQFHWTTNWGIRLEPPWYSAYANARMGLNGALLFRLTGDDRYATLARNAVAFIGLPVKHGGAQYDILGFKLPAEYVYPSPPIPNVRVLDGELIVAAALFDIARLLGDSELLRLFMTQVGSLAMQIESYLRPDGSLEFSMYIEEMPQHYRWDIWSALQVLGNVSKDRRFSIIAREYAKHIPQEWKGRQWLMTSLRRRRSHQCWTSIQTQATESEPKNKQRIPTRRHCCHSNPFVQFKAVDALRKLEPDKLKMVEQLDYDRSRAGANSILEYVYSRSCPGQPVTNR